MSHARLTHPIRPTLEFRGGQESQNRREAVASVTSELATDRKPLVHTETREVTETERGTATGLRRARNATATSDPRQALANYAVELEAHVDEYQGDPGYQYVNDQTGVSKDAVLERIEWSLSPGEVYELNYEATVQIGRSLFDSRDISPESVTPGAPFDAMLRLDGIELPGMREYRVETSIGVEPKAVFDRSSAENNDIKPTEGGGRQRIVAYTGVHTGTRAQRASDDNALEAVLGGKNNITLETDFPGYEMDGYLTEYSSTFSQNRAFGDAAEGTHRYSIQFVEGVRS